jgi:hypothetical protein
MERAGLGEMTHIPSTYYAFLRLMLGFFVRARFPLAFRAYVPCLEIPSQIRYVFYLKGRHLKFLSVGMCYGGLENLFLVMETPDFVDPL